MGQDAILIFGRAFGRDHDLVTHVRESQTDLFLAVGIGVGRVKIADTAIKSRLKQLDGVFFVTALNGETAHGRLGDRKAGLAQTKILHNSSLIPIVGSCTF